MMQPPAASLVIRGVRLFDGVAPTTRDPATIVLRDDEIVYAGAAAGAPPPDHDARLLDADGLTAMPGLIELHNRSDGVEEMATYVRGGVTSVRFGGIDQPALARLRATVGDDPARAPRIFSSGPMLEAAPASWPQWTTVLESPAHAACVAETLAADGGVVALTTAQNVDAELLAPIVAAAHAHGLPVVGQTWRLDGGEAARLGIDQVDNTSRVFVSSLWPRRGPRSFARVADRIECWARGWSSVDWDATMRMVDTMVEHGVAHCPTLTAHYWWTDLRRHELAQDPLFAAASREAALTPNQRTLRHVERTWTRELKMVMRAALSNREEWLRRFHGAGGRIVIGSDTRFGGVMLHSELRYLHDAGLPAGTVVRGATSAAADVMRCPHLGRIARGCRGDVLLVEGDPDADVSACRRIRVVVRAGRVAIDEREPLATAVHGSGAA